MAKSFPEVFVSNRSIALQVSRGVKQGSLKKLGSRVYTTNLNEEPKALVRRHVWTIVEGLFPGALIADRTALEHRPSKEGAVFIVSDKKRPILLPGLIISPRKGPPPLDTDKPFMGGLFLSSPARAYLDNLRKTRSINGISRTLSRVELEEKLEALLRAAGSETLQNLRDECRKIAPFLDRENEYQALDALIGTLLGTRSEPLSASITIARFQKTPYDPKRLDLFQCLYETLSTTPVAVRKILHPGAALPFFEAYFSNFIEGTEMGDARA
jgi:hypothetical protein